MLPTLDDVRRPRTVTTALAALVFAVIAVFAVAGVALAMTGRALRSVAAPAR